MNIPRIWAETTALILSERWKEGEREGKRNNDQSMILRMNARLTPINTTSLPAPKCLSRAV